MTFPDDAGPTAATPAAVKPSLMGGLGEAAMSRDSTRESTQPLRMLDALGEARPGRRESAPNRIRLWLLALSLTMLAVAAVSWWQQRNEMATGDRAGPVDRAALELTPPASAEPPAQPAPEAPLVPAPLVVAAAPVGPASIERSAELHPLQVLSRPETAPAPAAVAPLAPTPASATTSAPAPTSAPATAPRAKTTPATAPGTKAAAVTEPRRKAAASPARSAKVVTAKAAPRPATTRRPEAPASPRDPDVALLSAMLARLSNDNTADEASQRATMARLVERCDGRGGKASSEAAECRRQVCAGRWGKSASCPAALAPKRH